MAETIIKYLGGKNVYLLYQTTTEPIIKPVLDPAASAVSEAVAEQGTQISVSENAKLQAQLLTMAEGITRNSEQLDLLVSQIGPEKSPEMLAKQAEWQEKVRQAREERRQRERDGQFLHLTGNERTVVMHQYWLSKNEAELKLTEAEWR